MPKPRKATDEQILDAYRRSGMDIRATAVLLQMNKGQVYFRLRAMGARTVRGPNQNLEPPTITCLGCGCGFVPKIYTPCHQGKLKYCSRACYAKAAGDGKIIARNRNHSANRRRGPTHPRWVADRDALRMRRRLKWLVYKLIRRCLGKARKTASSEALLGYTAEQLQQHLESLFSPGMSWDNYGPHGWHVDHKKPVAAFKHSADVREVNALSNLQPLWWRDNAKKGARLI